MRYFALLLVGIFISTLFIQCDDPSLQYSLNREEQKQVDSLFKSQMRDLQDLADSLCADEKTKKYQYVKDSLIELRLSEIEDILPE